MTAARKLDERPALSVAEVAQRLGVHAKTIRREIKRGRVWWAYAPGRGRWSLGTTEEHEAEQRFAAELAQPARARPGAACVAR